MLTLLVLQALLFSLEISALNARQWSHLSIYQVLTDRFALSDGSSPDCWIRSYCGGTYKGLENKLNYIQDMGFDAVWISPVIHNIEGNTSWGYAYHGYWGDDPNTLNPHFGSSEDLKSLSNALHARNMSLMLDVVVNHLAANQTNADVEYSRFPPPFNDETAFNPNCQIDYANQTSIEQCWLVDELPPLLADVKTHNWTTYNAMVQSVVQLVRKYDIDGIRLDTARHISKPELRQFQDEVGVFVTGEALNESIPFVSQYQGPLDSALNYPLFYIVQDTFTGRTTFDLLASTVVATQAVYLDPNSMTNFLDNHDQPRLASRPGSDLVRDMNAVTFLFLTPGIPIVYYGFEHRFAGGEDPENREGLWISGYNASSALYGHISRLNHIRKAAIDFDTSDVFLESKITILHTSDNHMAFQRGQLVVVVTNVAEESCDLGSHSTTETTLLNISVTRSSFPPNSPVLDLLTCEWVITDGDGSFTSTTLAGRPRVWSTYELGYRVCA